MKRITLGSLLLLVAVYAHGESAGQQVLLKTIGTSTYYVDSQIEGVGVTSLLVDTGSGYSTINQETLADLKEAGNATFLKQLEGIMADGSRMIVPVYRISAFNLGGKCLIRDIEVAVFPSGSRQILGLSALSKVAPFVFSLDPPSLTLSNCIVPEDTEQYTLGSFQPVNYGKAITLQ